MKRAIVATSISACVVLAMPGCETYQRQSRTTKGAVIGTAGGAAVGSAIGAIADGGEGAWKGAAIGAAVGALGGGLIGNYMDKQAEEMQAVLSEQDRIRREQETLHVTLGSDVLFDSGSSTLQPGARDKLAEVADVLTQLSPMPGGAEPDGQGPAGQLPAAPVPTPAPGAPPSSSLAARAGGADRERPEQNG